MRLLPSQEILRRFGLKLAGFLPLVACLTSLGARADTPQTRTYFLHIDPKGTFLFTNQDRADPASRFDLGPLYADPTILLKPGDLLSIEAVGAFKAGSAFPDGIQSLLAIFVNGSGQVLSAGPKSTVAHEVSLPTAVGNLPTDIPQSFGIPFGDSAMAQIPLGAQALLFSPNDSSFGDNSDPNGDFGVDIVITVVNLDLSVTKISLAQPIGTDVPLDAAGNPIISTTTSPIGGPAPAIPPVQVEAQVTVTMTGAPSDVTGTELVLALADQEIARKTVDLSQFHPGDNIVKVDFTPPTDSGFIGVKQMTATVNASQSVQEADHGNNIFSVDVNTMVLCKVEDAGRSVPFHAQIELPWSAQAYGIPGISSGTFMKYGCSITDLYMLFSSYGINSTPLGSPADPFGVTPTIDGLKGEALTPGTLNSAMANYTTDIISKGSVGFDGRNDPIWPGAAEIGRAGYRAQCLAKGTCNAANAPNVVSFKAMNYSAFTDQQAIEAVQNEVCSGNPVIMKFRKSDGGQHYMLATGIVLDGDKNQTLRLNNPGTNAPTLGADAFYTDLQDTYPSSIGYVLYRPSSDPSMMLIAAPMGIHFVVTDPLGRRAGFDPVAGKSFSEIPGAAYGEQSINTPGDAGFTPSTLVDERYFVSSSDVPAGSYQVAVFSVTGGSYYLDYRSFDSTGTTNDAHLTTGTLNAGGSAAVTLQHVITSSPIPDALLSLSSYSIHESCKENLKDTDLKISGTLALISKSPVTLKSSLQLSIGGITGYELNLPAAKFRSQTDRKKTTYTYGTRDIGFVLDSTGAFEVEIKHADLTAVDRNLLGSVSLGIDSAQGSTHSDFQCRGDSCSIKNTSRHFHHSHPPMGHDDNDRYH